LETKIIQITSGRGPAECCWVVAQVLKLFIEALKEEQIAYAILHKEQGMENRTLQSVIVQIEGRTLDLFLNPWRGTIKWIGVSSFRPQHKRKSWFIGLYEIEDHQVFQINEKDIIYQATRSSGPGGQHVNKVSSAIRAIHKPSKTQVFVMDSRSQHQNKKIAKRRLEQKLNELRLKTLKTGVKTQWQNHLKLERGNPVKIFIGSDFKVQKKEKNYKKQRQQLKTDLKNLEC